MAGTVISRVGKPTDSKASQLDNLPWNSPLRRQTWFVGPIDRVDYYIGDTSFEARGAGHAYNLPEPDTSDPLRAGTWLSPGAADLHRIKPASGFPNLHYELRGTSHNGIATIEIHGLDSQLREAIEEVTWNVTAAATERVMGAVPWRQIHRVVVKTPLQQASGAVMTSGILSVGYFLAATEAGGFFDFPQEAPQAWATGFPVPLVRDNRLGPVRTHNVDGYNFLDTNGWSLAAGTVPQSRTNVLIAVFGAFQGGGFGLQPDRVMDGFEEGTFGSLGTWQPPVGSRPLVSAGLSGGFQVNRQQYRLYFFQINHRSSIPSLVALP